MIKTIHFNTLASQIMSDRNMYDRILVLIKGNNWDPWLNYVAFVRDPGTLSIYVCA